VSRFTEAAVELAAIAEFKALGYAHRFGPEIAAEGLFPERQGYGDVFLRKTLAEALAKINPGLPAEAIEDAVRQITRPEHPALVLNNRAFTGWSPTASTSGTATRRDAK
jgi:type I restriction enzyme R subunit